MIPRTVLLLLLSGSLLFSGCSEDKQQPEKEQSSINAQAEQAGKDAAAAIKTPLDKAGAVSDLQNEHNKALEKQAKDQ